MSIAGHLYLDTRRSFLLPVERGLYVYFSMQEQHNFISKLKKLSLDLSDEAEEQLSVLNTQEHVLQETQRNEPLRI